MEMKTQGFNVMVAWQPQEGKTLKECLIAGVVKAMEDLMDPVNGLLKDIEVGWINHEETGEPMAVYFIEENGENVALGMIVVGEMEMPPEMEAEAKDAAKKVEAEEHLRITEDDIKDHPFVARKDIAEG